MSYASKATTDVPWWREPTKDQWYAFIAAWLGWTLDAFDFTVFLLIMVAIAKEFNEPLAAVTIVFTLTLWMRLFGAVAAGWMADRMGRKAPLMISILWYSVCNFIAGFSPNFVFLLVFRTLLGIGMGAEWPAGAALAMETWPPRSRGLMSSILQGSWALGYLLSALLYATVFQYIGWRGMLWLGVLPALAVVWIRIYVKEPEVWVENQKNQKAQHAEMKVPLFAIFRRGMLWNTFTACWWMASGFVVYYSVFGLFATYLTRDLHMSPAAVGWPLVLTNAATFAASFLWGGLSDRIGRRWAMIIPAIIGFFITPVYLLTTDYLTIVIAFTLQGACVGAIYGQNPSYLSERFPTEVRATAAAFCYHQGAIFAGVVAPVLTYIAVNMGYGFAIPMLVLTSVALISFVISLILGPETKGKVLIADLEILPAE
jgi:SHS family lactate transporter-like MFS transporter